MISYKSSCPLGPPRKCSFCGEKDAYLGSTAFGSFVRTGVTRSFCSEQCGKAYPGSKKQAEDNLALARSDAARAAKDIEFWGGAALDRRKAER
jgi:hypothetical protein